MMNTHDYIRAAEWLTEQSLSILPMLRADRIPASDELLLMEQMHSGILTDSAEVVNACAGLDRRSVFLTMRAGKGGLQASHGKCRYLAEKNADIRQLDALVGPFLEPGYLEEISLRVQPDMCAEGFSAQNIPAFARLIRRSENLAVRALFLPFDLRGDLSCQAKAAFSLVKQIRADLPCTLHAFCFEGLLAPLMQGNKELLKTLQMLASLNDTSLYAVFYIS